MITQNRRKDITYGRIVCNYCSEKKDPYHTRITMGGKLINYLDDCGTPTADLITVKIMFNSVISMPNPKFMMINIKDFYLMTPMDRYEYFCIKLELFPPDIIDEYRLRNKVDADGNVFCKVQRGMYGLPQAGIIAQDLLTIKLMFNSIISTPNAKFITIDIKDFYLTTPMERYKYFRVILELFPQDIINEYGLRDKVDADGNVFCKV